MKDKKECRWIEINNFTIKLTFLPSSGIYYNPIVKIRIMKSHPFPKNFWERISENFKYPAIDSLEWDSLFSLYSLEDKIRNYFEANTKKALRISKAYDEYINLF